MAVNIDTRTGPSFSLRNRLARLLFDGTWYLLAQWTPNPLHGWRRWLLRRFGARIGRHAHIYGKVRIWAPWNLEVGEYSGIGNGVTLYCQGKIVIGRRVVISQGAHLCGGTHDYTDPGFRLVPRDIIIGDDVWIAAEAFVHPGVTVGDGAILGARGVAVKSLEPWTIYAGNPARAVKRRPHLPQNY